MTLSELIEEAYGLTPDPDFIEEVRRLALQELGTFPANNCQYCNSDKTRYTVAVHCDRCATTIETGGIL